MTVPLKGTIKRVFRAQRQIFNVPSEYRNTEQRHIQDQVGLFFILLSDFTGVAPTPNDQVGSGRSICVSIGTKCSNFSDITET